MDKSKVTCEKKYEIPLIYLYLAKHQKTWYEDKFSAQPLELPNYTDKKAQLRAHLKTKPEWEVFAKECSMIPSF